VTLALCRYAGSKQAICSNLFHVMARVKEENPVGTLRRFNRYLTPTLGAGSDFYYAILNNIADEYVGTDLNPAVVAAHQATKESLTALLGGLRTISDTTLEQCKELYLAQRTAAPTSTMAQAVRFLFLIGSGVNGIWRESAKSGYNVPFGKRYTLSPAAQDRITQCSQVLNQAPTTLTVCDFAETLAQAKEGDLVYIDPPFYKSNFRYVSTWGAKEHQRLALHAKEARNRGASVFISNSDCPETRLTYTGIYHPIEVRSDVATSVKGRGLRRELLIEVT
jgi:DNA adenine methylase